jgi:hypothetical protein
MPGFESRMLTAFACFSAKNKFHGHATAEMPSARGVELIKISVAIH